MPEIRRYRLMPVVFDTTHHFLGPSDPAWDSDTRQLHEENREKLVNGLRYTYGQANLEGVIQNTRELGSDPWSTIGWHIQLWRQVRHAFVSGAYYPAAVGAGALAERILNHLLRDLMDDYASTKDRKTITADKPPTYELALKIVKRWGFLEPEALTHFRQLGRLRNKLVHFDPRLYADVRGRTIEAVTRLRDAIDSQFGVFVERRLIEGVPGTAFVRKEVEAEPFFREYLKPVALHVSPRHSIDLDSATGLWSVTAEESVVADVDSDDEFVRHYLSEQNFG